MQTICILSRPKRRGLEGSPVKLFFTLETISRNFNVPISRAAENLGLGLTAFKHMCRKFGILKWPYRKTKQLNALNALVGDPTDYKSALQQSNNEKEEAAEENDAVLDFALADVFFETSPSGQCSSDDEIDFTDVSFQGNDSEPRGFGDSSAQFLFAYSFSEDFWNRKTDPVDMIPDAAALQPFVDPFHGDWAATTTSVAACTQGTCLSSI